MPTKGFKIVCNLPIKAFSTGNLGQLEAIGLDCGYPWVEGVLGCKSEMTDYELYEGYG